MMMVFTVSNDDSVMVMIAQICELLCVCVVQWTANGKKGSPKKKKVASKKVARRSSTVASSDSEKGSASEPEEGMLSLCSD